MIDERIVALIRERRPIVVVSHPRSGTHLTIDFLRLNFRACGGWKFPLEANNLVYLSLDGISLPNPLLDNNYALKVLSRAATPVIKTHSAGPEFDDVGFFGDSVRYIPSRIAESLRESARFLYVIRDCRSVMTSFHHWMSGFNLQVRKSGFYEFLQQEPRPGVNRIQQWRDHVANWQTCNNLMTIRFEDMISDCREVACRISAFTEIPIESKLLLPGKTSVLKSRVNRLISWRPGSTAILGQNKGKPGKWARLISEEQSRDVLLDAIGTLEKFGYTT